MARLARVVAAGLPHHVTQRGNRRQQVFFGDADYAAYRRLLAEACRAAEVAVWAYCLMPNHVHLILGPSNEDGLRAALGEAHRRYTRLVNSREGWRGYLWQGRFASFPMDERHLLACARYVELNPVRAGLAAAAGDWPWSSARAHLIGRNDSFVQVKPLLDLVPDWPGFLRAGLDEDERDATRAAERTGRPLGAAPFTARLETRLRARSPVASRAPSRKPPRRGRNYVLCPRNSYS
jgi:putative transposase